MRITNTFLMTASQILLWPMAAALVVILTLPGLSGPFVFDDIPNLQRLQLIDGELNRERIGNYLASFPGTPGRPISTLSFLINDLSWPSTPEGFKWTNLCFHLLAGLMLFGFVRQVVLAYEEGHSVRSNRAFWVALIASSAWMIHPIQVSTVFLVVQRMTILSAIFVLAGLWLYVSTLRRSNTWLGCLLALSVLGVFTLLAFLCKENGALAPLYAWVLHGTVLGRQLRTPAYLNTRQLARRVIPVAALTPFLGLLAMPDRWLDFSNRSYSLAERLLTQPRVLFDYVHAIILPRISGGGSLFHDSYEVSTGLLDPPSSLIALTALGSAIALAFALRRKHPWVSFAILWFIAGHSIESTFVSLELYFEHRNYLPVMGIIVATVYATSTASARLRPILAVAFAIWLGLSAWVTRAQAEVWSDERLMAAAWATEHPNSSRAVHLQAKVLHDRGDLDGAYRVFESAANARQGALNAQKYMLMIDCQRGTAVSSRQLERVEAEIISEQPSLGSFALMEALRSLAQESDCEGFGLREWVKLSDAALKNPRRHSLQHIHHERARALDALGLRNAAIIELQRAYDADPDAERAILVARQLAADGRLDDANTWLRKGCYNDHALFKKWISGTHRKCALFELDFARMEAQSKK